MGNAFDLIAMLADGKLHSGATLARRLCISQAVVRERVRHLIMMGIEIESLYGQNHRLIRPLDLLDAQAIRQLLATSTRESMSDIEVLIETDSTNAQLMRQGAAGAPARRACLAESQTAGRGRSGKRWISPFGANLYMSLSWRFEPYPSRISRLSLITALAIAETLTALGAQDIALKWPNDLHWRQRKFGGILLETTRTSGSGYVVIGIGVNLRMPALAGGQVDQPWTDLVTIMGEQQMPSRNLLAARLLDTLVSTLQAFERGHGTGLSKAWRQFDCISGQVVALHTDFGEQRGKALGIDADGRLLLEINGRPQAFACGEVSLAPERHEESIQ